jgi:hypothetical protein
MAHLETNLHPATPLFDESPKNDVEVPQGGNPYEPPASELLEAEEVSETDELNAYVDKNTDYYLNQWEKPDPRGNPSYRFNWAAFFLTGIWMAYRQMYWQFLAVLGATVVVSLIIQTLGMSQTWIPNLAVGLVCGFFGSKWYHNHALRVIRKTKLKEPLADERIKLLAKRGKKTRPIVLIAIIAFVFIAFLIYTFVMS